MKKTYRLLEIEDKLINNSKPFWRVEKKNIFGFWTEYFEQHSEYGATFYNKEEAEKLYYCHLDKQSRIKEKIIAQKTI